MKASGITLLSCLSATVLAASALHAQQAPAPAPALFVSRPIMVGPLNNLVVDKGAQRVQLAAPGAKP